MEIAYVCSWCGRLFHTMNERDTHTERCMVAECPFCKLKGEMISAGQNAQMCTNCNRVLTYCEGIGLYEETDE
jgi:DNA-directed RNA polymerase subunit RPC12/RpoP